jgi:hypothetical protein
MMDQEQAANSPSFLSRLGKALAWLIRFVLRLLVVLAVGTAIGAGIYFGGMFAYRQFLEPVPVHTIRLDILEGRQDQIVERFAEQQEDLQVRIADLEAQSDAQKLAFDRLHERLGEVETAQANAIARLDEAFAELGQIQAGLEEVQTAQDEMQLAQDAGQADLEALRVNLEAVQAGLTSARNALEAMESDLAAMQAGVADLTEQVDAYGMDVLALNEALSGERSPSVLFHQLQLVKAMELLTRARLVLVQNNLALAQFDIQAARRVLVDLQVEVPAYQSEQIARIVVRLDAVLSNLPAAPVAAADELEGAWQLLIAGLSVEPNAASASESTPTATPVPEEPTATPAPSPTPTPSTQS